jgi:hypothetical protein
LFKIFNLRQFFTDRFELLAQPCIPIRAFFIYGTGLGGTGRDEIARDGIGRGGKGYDGTRWDGTGRGATGRDGTEPRQRVAGNS